MKKVVVITGASSGIGYDTALLLVQKGYTVYGLSRSKITQDLILSMQVDVTQVEQVKTAFSDIYKQEQQIDIVINNAGMGISGSVEHSSIKDIDDILDVNFKGLFYVSQTALPYLRMSKGKLINVGSVAGTLSIPFQAFYSASKAAVQSFSDALSIEVKPMGIQVCTVLPGDIKTGFTKNRRKNIFESELYIKRVEQSIGVMEKDEQNGMSSSHAAKVFLKLVYKRRMPLVKTIGFKYKVFVFLEKILPKRFVVWIIGLLYGFNK
ncbi:MAG: SDR family NAD(P)-dependent oxidoreductase [Acholeplasmataceae bacterium]